MNYDEKENWEIYIRQLSEGKNAEKEIKEICKTLNQTFAEYGATFKIVEDGKGIISNYFHGLFKTIWSDDDFPEFGKGQENLFADIFIGEENYSIVAASSELIICRWIYEGASLMSFEKNLQNGEKVFLDAYGNFCSLNDDNYGLRVCDNSNSEDGMPVIPNVLSLPIKQMFDPLMADDVSTEVLKFPMFMHKEMMLLYNCEEEDFSEYLRDNGAYLLDKDGNKITSLKAFHHSEPDGQGYVRYPVPVSDLVEAVTFAPMFTEEAGRRWRSAI